MKKLIEKINVLSKKAKTRELSNEEKEEQKKLREEYLKIFRSNFKNRLDNVKIVDKEDIN